MKFENYMILDFPSRSSNEAFARSAVACFAAQMDPTLEELGDIRTAVSEAVTNCIVHAYNDSYSEKERKIMLSAKYTNDGLVTVRIKAFRVSDESPQRMRERQARCRWGYPLRHRSCGRTP